jgi:hypothetical protein
MHYQTQGRGFSELSERKVAASAMDTKAEKKEEKLWLKAFCKIDTSGDMQIEVPELREWFATSPLPEPCPLGTP